MIGLYLPSGEIAVMSDGQPYAAALSKYSIGVGSVLGSSTVGRRGVDSPVARSMTTRPHCSIVSPQSDASAIWALSAITSPVVMRYVPSGATWYVPPGAPETTSPPA